MPDYTITIDTREQKPPPFPSTLRIVTTPAPSLRTSRARIFTHRDSLTTADYALLGHEDRALIERKGSLREIASNTLTRDRPRFIRSLDRLATACLYPYLLLEASPTAIVAEHEPPFDSLLHLLVERRISLLLLPSSTQAQRLSLGRILARLLIAGAQACPNPPTIASTPPAEANP